MTDFISNVPKRPTVDIEGIGLPLGPSKDIQVEHNTPVCTVFHNIHIQNHVNKQSGMIAGNEDNLDVLRSLNTTAKDLAAYESDVARHYHSMQDDRYQKIRDTFTPRRGEAQKFWGEDVKKKKQDLARLRQQQKDTMMHERFNVQARRQRAEAKANAEKERRAMALKKKTQEEEAEKERAKANKSMEQRMKIREVVEEVRTVKQKEFERECLKRLRYIDAYREHLVDKARFLKLELPPLCSCGYGALDNLPELCANNCMFRNNPEAHSKYLTILIESLNVF
eukprot:GFYU01017203.1.p1 GENE.GFYU01017203.1~~GFYU01017203.1.p1  ORF type:complete len:281 (+),score=88.24 GFYU01017203.1:179-1021(+)